jgi:hypothetical protein
MFKKIKNQMTEGKNDLPVLMKVMINIRAADKNDQDQGLMTSIREVIGMKRSIVHTKMIRMIEEIVIVVEIPDVNLDLMIRVMKIIITREEMKTGIVKEIKERRLRKILKRLN